MARQYCFTTTHTHTQTENVCVCIDFCDLNKASLNTSEYKIFVSDVFFFIGYLFPMLSPAMNKYGCNCGANRVITIHVDSG